MVGYVGLHGACAGSPTMCLLLDYSQQIFQVHAHVALWHTVYWQALTLHQMYVYHSHGCAIMHALDV